MNCSSHHISSGYFKVNFFQTASVLIKAVVIVYMLIQHMEVLNRRHLWFHRKSRSNAFQCFLLKYIKKNKFHVYFFLISTKNVETFVWHFQKSWKPVWKDMNNEIYSVTRTNIQVLYSLCFYCLIKY